MTKRGIGQGGWSTKKSGEVSQRVLLVELRVAIKDAQSKQPSLHRDEARRRLRELRNEDWNTPHVLYNLNPRRCRYLASLGWPIPQRAMWPTERQLASLETLNDRT